MASRDSAHNVKPVSILQPQARIATVAAATANSVDTSGYESVWFGIQLGTWTDGIMMPLPP